MSSRVTYYLIYTTEYLLTSEGTEIRANRSSPPSKPA